MRYFTLFIFFLCSSSSFAQTKLIAFKSLGGSSNNFHLAMETFSNDLKGSNFGQAPRPLVYCAKLDTVWYLSDSVSVISTSDMCQKKCDNSKGWIPGRDTLINHPLFSKKNNLKFIKNRLRLTYNFRNPVDSIVFIGYDSKMELPEENAEEEGLVITDITRYNLSYIAMFLSAIYFVVTYLRRTPERA
jgi:hypothetical protein